MEFEFTVPGLGAQHITRWDAHAIRALSPSDQGNLKLVVDAFGKRSAIAQSLGAPITDIPRLRSTNQRLFLCASYKGGCTTLLGGLKVGTKRLFVSTELGALKEIEPMCILDFYVHESLQRQGIGGQLFEHFVREDQCAPATLAYDRPSPKLMAFLRRYYGLSDHIPQNNNYVVFNKYWHTAPGKAYQRSTDSLLPSTSRRAVPTDPVSPQQPASSNSRPSGGNYGYNTSPLPSNNSPAAISTYAYQAASPLQQRATAPANASSAYYGGLAGPQFTAQYASPQAGQYGSPAAAAQYTTPQMGQYTAAQAAQQWNQRTGGGANESPGASYYSPAPASPSRLHIPPGPSYSQPPSPRPGPSLTAEDSIDRFQADAAARGLPSGARPGGNLDYDPYQTSNQRMAAGGGGYPPSGSQQASPSGRSQQSGSFGNPGGRSSPYRNGSTSPYGNVGVRADGAPHVHSGIGGVPYGNNGIGGAQWGTDVGPSGRQLAANVGARVSAPWADGGQWSVPMPQTVMQQQAQQRMAGGGGYGGESRRQQPTQQVQVSGPMGGLMTTQAVRAAAAQQRSGAGAANCLVW